MQHSRRSLFGAITALLAATPAWMAFPRTAMAGVSEQVEGRGDRLEPRLPEGAYIQFDGDNREVTMTFDRYDDLASPGKLSGVGWYELPVLWSEHRVADDPEIASEALLPGDDAHLVGYALVHRWDSREWAEVDGDFRETGKAIVHQNVSELDIVSDSPMAVVDRWMSGWPSVSEPYADHWERMAKGMFASGAYGDTDRHYVRVYWTSILPR